MCIICFFMGFMCIFCHGCNIYELFIIIKWLHELACPNIMFYMRMSFQNYAKICCFLS